MSPDRTAWQVLSMTPTEQGSIRLFRFAGIDAYLHWSWFLVAVFEVTQRKRNYSSLWWNAAEYLALFGIVLLHEFGHALACRQVGGQANRIVLWPLGGVAYVQPPQRPGATLWSIVAGPLVNVVLVPILGFLWWGCAAAGWAETQPNAYLLMKSVCLLNVALLVFNLLPVYPLDGGQILRSLLWFMVGRARSLLVTSIVGFAGVAVLIGVAIWMQSVLFGVMCAFILMNCWGGLQQARMLARAAKLPRHPGFACPDCQSAPPVGAFWLCGKCRTRFDTFLTGAVCPQCGTQFSVTSCLDCGVPHPLSAWLRSPPLPPGN